MLTAFKEFSEVFESSFLYILKTFRSCSLAGNCLSTLHIACHMLNKPSLCSVLVKLPHNGFTAFFPIFLSGSHHLVCRLPCFPSANTHETTLVHLDTSIMCCTWDLCLSFWVLWKCIFKVKAKWLHIIICWLDIQLSNSFQWASMVPVLLSFLLWMPLVICMVSRI